MSRSGGQDKAQVGRCLGQVRLFSTGSFVEALMTWGGHRRKTLIQCCDNEVKCKCAFVSFMKKYLRRVPKRKRKKVEADNWLESPGKKKWQLLWKVIQILPRDWNISPVVTMIDSQPMRINCFLGLKKKKKKRERKERKCKTILQSNLKEVT